MFRLFLMVFVASCSVCMLSLPAKGAPPVRKELRVNTASFTGYSAFQVRRVVESATAAWQWGANAGIHYEYVGTTADTGCWAGNSNHIYASAGCHSSGCGRSATMIDCPFGGFAIEIHLGFNGGGGFSLGTTPGSDQIDLQSTIQHELGHDWSWLHIDEGDPSGGCTLSNGVFGSTGRRGTFCRTELHDLTSDWDWGTEQHDVRLLRSPTSYDPGLTWTPITVSGLSAGGRNFVSFERANPSAGLTATVFRTNSGNCCVLNHQSEGPYPNISSLTAINNAAPALTQPVTVHDYIRGRWWRFFRTDSASTPNGVDFSARSGSVGWSTGSPVLDGAGSRISTRLPVGAAYDWYTDRIIVLFAAWDGVSASTSGQLRYTSISASGSGGWSPVVSLSGETTVGPPAIACEASSAAENCAVLIQGTDVERMIWGFAFGINHNGSMYSKTSAQNTGGWTDYPIGLAFGGPGLQAKMIAVVRSASVDGRIAISRKDRAWNSWPAWGYLSHYAGSAALIVKRGDTDFELMHAPMP